MSLLSLLVWFFLLPWWWSIFWRFCCLANWQIFGQSQHFLSAWLLESPSLNILPWCITWASSMYRIQNVSHATVCERNLAESNVLYASTFSWSLVNLLINERYTFQTHHCDLQFSHILIFSEDVTQRTALLCIALQFDGFNCLTIVENSCGEIGCFLCLLFFVNLFYYFVYWC